MSFENYTMGWRATLPTQRYHDYRAGLLDPWEVVVFYQDMIEAGVVPASLWCYVQHFLETGLCRLPELMPYN